MPHVQPLFLLFDKQEVSHEFLVNEFLSHFCLGKSTRGKKEEVVACGSSLRKQTSKTKSRA
jgi:hypothetical protein